MLKKLVKYGNSNALILDKAILEILDIEEGSILKIKTDGKSIIITPQVKVQSEQVHETFTHDQALMEAAAQETVKRYKNSNKNEQKKLSKELSDLYQRRQNLADALHQNPDFFKELTELASQQLNVASSEYIEAYKALRNKFSPELSNIENEITAFNAKREPLQKLNEKQQKAMEVEFLAIHQKYNNSYKINNEFLNSPEYLHEAQLIAEKFNYNKDSADFMSAMDELTYKYNPEFRQAHKELRAITEKYFTNQK
jgi:antitoxin component of MazEF toxin-antitoxin module